MRCSVYPLPNSRTMPIKASSAAPAIAPISAAARARPRRYEAIRALSRSNSSAGGSAAVSALSLPATRRRRQCRETATPSSTPKAIQSRRPITPAIFGRRPAHRNRSRDRKQPRNLRRQSRASARRAVPIAFRIARSQERECALHDRRVPTARAPFGAPGARRRSFPARQLHRSMHEPAPAAGRRPPKCWRQARDRRDRLVPHRLSKMIGRGGEI